MTDCHHPTTNLSNIRTPSVGDTMQGRNVSLEADCECGETVLLDCRVTEVMSL